MALSIGSRVGPYEVVALVGEGGMGQVYRAHDSRLRRDVALKVLPEHFVNDPDRLSRFEREAQLLAALNHPHVAQIYGLEHAGGTSCIVMELVDGDTLHDRIRRGPIPLGEAIALATQIADALAAAHERGIVHRDLKPANIKVTSEGTIKILDFGLAKLATGETAPAPGSPGLGLMSNSPTVVAPSMSDVILGTLAYMSPEQARGKAVDARTDVWAFGCVLYEMLTGQPAFDGETTSDVVAKILTADPDWSRLPPQTPGTIRTVLAAMLQKDVKQRLQHVVDSRLLLRLDPETARASSRRWSLSTGRAAALLAFALITGAVAGLLWKSGSTRVEPVRRLSITIPDTIRAFESQLVGDTLVVLGAARSPDGVDDPRARIYTRRLGEYEFKPVEGTDGAQRFASVAISPNGEWIAFVATASEQSAQLQLKKVRSGGGGPPVAIAEWKDSWSGFNWLNDDELIVLANSGTSFFRQPSSGAPAGPAVKIDMGPASAFLFVAPSGANPVVGDRGLFLDVQTYVARGFQSDQWLLDTSTGKAIRLFENAGHASYLPSGHVVFTRGESLMAAPFDASRLAVSGEIAALSSGVRVNEEGDHGWFQVSSDGSLIYVPGGRVGSDRQLIVADSKGTVTPFVAERRAFAASETPQISPDGRKAAVVVTSPSASYEIWVAALDGLGIRRVVTSPSADAAAPVWSPDGQRLAYARAGLDKDKDGVYVQRLDGTSPAQFVAKVPSPESQLIPVSWTRDGQRLIVLKTAGGRRSADVAIVDVRADGAPGTLKDLSDSPSRGSHARVSPDGHFIAFGAEESGRFELYVAPLSADGRIGARQPVASDIDRGFIRGAGLGWSDSRHLFYRALPNKIMSVAIDTTAQLSASTPVMAFDLDKLRVNPYSWDVLPNGGLLAVQRGRGEDEIKEYHIVINWLTELRQRIAQ